MQRLHLPRSWMQEEEPASAPLPLPVVTIPRYEERRWLFRPAEASLWAWQRMGSCLGRGREISLLYEAWMLWSRMLKGSFDGVALFFLCVWLVDSVVKEVQTPNRWHKWHWAALCVLFMCVAGVAIAVIWQKSARG
ncbi:unnamed protein product [Durusdinium trenchii]|uniref:Uncharacterized protein n=1 Tax=Durusdinium trenchii TaxID=1381693 RepID=A0ABP0L8D6_9DINO